MGGSFPVCFIYFLFLPREDVLSYLPIVLHDIVLSIREEYFEILPQ